MIHGRALITGTIVALALCAAAHAADPPGSWGYERPAPRYVEMVSGWYVRGDFGYRFNEMDSVQAGQPATSFNYPDSLGVTLGGGYKYQWFRFDATVDYGPRVTARATSTHPTAPQPQYTTKIDALSLLANFYIDLGTWYGFTPYLGAGVGVTYLRSRDYEDTTLAINHMTSNGRTNLSWAAMGGVAYQINARWIADVGYRYLAMGDLPTSTNSNSVLDNTTWKRLSAQEIRIGLRFLLD